MTDAALSMEAAARVADPVPRRGRDRVDHVEWMRAVAILLVVCGHCYDLAGLDPAGLVTGAPGLTDVVQAIVTGGTAVFVFISGFLYRHVFFGRDFAGFMAGKARVVGLPYLTLGIPIALYEVLSGHYRFELLRLGTVEGGNLFLDLSGLLLTGRMMTAYWYIPFVFLLFLASPLVDAFVRAKRGPRAAVFLALVALAFVVHRPEYNLDPVHSFLYFAHVYLAGVLFREYHEPAMAWLRRAPVIALLAGAVVALAFVQVFGLGYRGNVEVARLGATAPVALDLMIPQKLLLALLLAGLLARWGGIAARLLSRVAQTSFGVFFLHGVVITLWMRLPGALRPLSGVPLLDLALYSAAVFGASHLAATLVVRVFGRRSRSLIGC
jgi:Uncharacterized protein conserved in bacteria